MEFATLLDWSQTQNISGLWFGHTNLSVLKTYQGVLVKKRQLIIWTVILLLSAISTTVQADTAAQKFGRGLAGMTCGFLELPGNIVRETDRAGIAGLPTGLARGVGMIVTRELVGVYEFITAPFPVPAGFRPIIQPEYPWSYFH